MSWMRQRSFALVAGSLGLAALLGGSLGFAAAGNKPALGAGYNLTGGPLNGDVQPDAFLGCLPASSWTALYIWDAQAQTWKHYLANVPAYVNASNVGGISIVPRFSGVVLIMTTAVASPKLRDSASEACS